MIIPSRSCCHSVRRHPILLFQASGEFETEELIAIAPGASGELKKAIILGIPTEGGGIVQATPQRLER
jgi:hypothetical protein